MVIDNTNSNNSDVCNKCGIYRGHAASCPTQLQTPEQRIRRAAHLIKNFGGSRGRKDATAEGIAYWEIDAGAELALAQLDIEYLIRQRYGDASYGARTLRYEDRREFAQHEAEVIERHIAEYLHDAQASSEAA